MRAIEVKDYAPVLRECFSSDPDLLSTYHIAAGSGLEGCVSKTVEDLKTAHPSFKFFKIMDNTGSTAGFFGYEKTDEIRSLTSFFIHPSHRHNKDAVWDQINKYFKGYSYMTFIYGKNTRAAKFLLNRGATLLGSFEHEGHPALAFSFGAICQ